FRRQQRERDLAELPERCRLDVSGIRTLALGDVCRLCRERCMRILRSLADVLLAAEIFRKVEQLLTAFVIQLTVDAEVLEERQLGRERALQRRERRTQKDRGVAERNLARIDQPVAVGILERVRLLEIRAGRFAVLVTLR